MRQSKYTAHRFMTDEQPASGQVPQWDNALKKFRPGTISIPVVPTVVRKTGNETVNNSAALQNDDHLKWTVAASEVWAFRMLLFVDGPEAGDMAVGFTVPTAGTIYYSVNSLALGTTTSTGALQSSFIVAPQGSANSGIGIDNAMCVVTIDGIYIGGANAGTVQFQWAQAVATVADTIVRAGSYLVAIKQ